MTGGMLSRCTHSEYIERKTQEEIEQFVAFDYLPVINYHYSVVGDSNKSLAPLEKQWISRSTKYHCYIHCMAINFPTYSRIESLCSHYSAE